MLFCFWLFVFSVHSVSSLFDRSNGYRNGLKNSHSNILASRWPKNNLEIRTDRLKVFENGFKNSDDQILAEESNEEPNYTDNYESDSSSPSTKSKKSQPYSFGYETNDIHGNKQYRHEKKHEQTVSGSYGYVDSNTGIFRHVQYIADKNGFRAHIKTSEPGTASKNPESVEIESTPVHLEIMKNDHKYEYQKQASDAVAKQTEPYIEMRNIKKQRQKSPFTINSSNDYKSPKDYMNSPSKYVNSLRENVSNLNDLNEDDHENSFNRDYEGSYKETSSDRTNDYNSYNPNLSTKNDAPIRHWTDMATDLSTEQNDQIDTQQDGSSDRRKNLYRARLF